MDTTKIAMAIGVIAVAATPFRAIATDAPPPRDQRVVKTAGLHTLAGTVPKPQPPIVPVQRSGSPIIDFTPTQDVKAPTGRSRVSGSPRAATGATARVEILAPVDLGRTSKAQPVIYWYLSERVDNPVDLFLSSADDREALLDVTLEPPIDAGVHGLSLAEHGVRLEPNRRYKLNVFVRSARDGPQSTTAIALLERVAPPSGVPPDRTSDPVDRAAAYARGGLWYDAFETLSAPTEQGQDSARARAARAQLLEQVGLALVADHVRGR